MFSATGHIFKEQNLKAQGGFFQPAEHQSAAASREGAAPAGTDDLRKFPRGLILQTLKPAVRGNVFRLKTFLPSETFKDFLKVSSIILSIKQQQKKQPRF